VRQELQFIHEIIQSSFINAHGLAVAQTVSLRPVTAGEGFVPRLVRVRFVVDRATVGQEYPIVLLCFLVSIISPMLLTRLYLNTSLSRGTTGEVKRGVWWANLRERDHLENLGVDGKGKLKWILMKRDGGIGLDLSGLEQTQMTGCCECGNEHSVSTGNFLTG
jgi:hypothetical protein